MNDKNGSETRFSIKNYIKNYDVFELKSLLLSRMTAESLLNSGFSEKLDARFSHVKDFDELPGQIIFMMTLEACSASANLDIKGAKNSFSNISISNYSGVNMGSFTTEVLWLLK